MSIENVVADNSNTAEEVALNTTENTDNSQNESGEESIEELKARLAKAEELVAKAEELANNQKIRAEKAERKAKENVNQAKAPAPTTENPVINSSRDLLALMNAKINDEDVSEVESYAKYKKVSIAEVLKLPELKAILSVKEQQRNLSNATSAGNSRRSVPKTSVDTLVNDFSSKGEFPEDREALTQMIRARKGLDKK